MSTLLAVTPEHGPAYRPVDTAAVVTRRWREFLAQRRTLVDEYEFVVQPRLAGHGPTLFAGLSKYVDLKLVSRLEFGSGAVAMRYEPRDAVNDGTPLMTARGRWSGHARRDSNHVRKLITSRPSPGRRQASEVGEGRAVLRSAG